MIAAYATTVADFHRWLLGTHGPGSPFVVLRFSERPTLPCAEIIARHLNEFDDRAAGDWLAISSPLLEILAQDPTQQRLLGIADHPSNDLPARDRRRGNCLAALAKRGRVVIDHPLAPEVVRDQPRGFRVAIGTPPRLADDYHLIIRPDAFGPRCLAPLIADSFLEWAESIVSSPSGNFSASRKNPHIMSESARSQSAPDPLS